MRIKREPHGRVVASNPHLLIPVANSSIALYPPFVDRWWLSWEDGETTDSNGYETFCELWHDDLDR